nr:hypothetical protein [Gammaproteobacteria bacterium]
MNRAIQEDVAVRAGFDPVIPASLSDLASYKTRLAHSMRGHFPMIQRCAATARATVGKQELADAACTDVESACQSRRTYDVRENLY